MATAIAHPKVITIQPLFCAFDLESSTPATTPSPRRISRPVPMTSEKKIWPGISATSLARSLPLFGCGDSTLGRRALSIASGNGPFYPIKELVGLRRRAQTDPIHRTSLGRPPAALRPDPPVEPRGGGRRAGASQGNRLRHHAHAAFGGLRRAGPGVG